MTLAERVAAMTPIERQRLMALAAPRVVDPYFVHIPHPKQQLFLTIQTREALFGGAAGGGKSDALLMAASQFVDVPGYSALILRRTWPDLNSPGAILDRARQWWEPMQSVKVIDGGRVFKFPSTARISFGYMNFERDKYKWQSSEFQFVGFDELTQFPESMYTYLFSRVRRPSVSCLNCRTALRWDASGGSGTGVHAWRHKPGVKCGDLYPDPKIIAQYPAGHGGMTVFDVPLRMRAATNPGGIGHDWVKARFIDKKTRQGDAIFVPSSLTDNPSLDYESYKENLMHLLPADRERLLNGDWDVFEQGEYFHREWFPVVTEAPKGRTVRFWDRAATLDDGDWTVGTKLTLSNEGRWYVEDVVRGQWSSAGCEAIVAQVAAQDGRAIPIRMEQEPGSAGKDVIHTYRTRVLVGYNFDGIPSTGDKKVRATPCSSAAEAGNILILPGEWNRKWLDELALFPFGANDDQIDSLSGAFKFLSTLRRARVLV